MAARAAARPVACRRRRGTFHRTPPKAAPTRRRAVNGHRSGTRRPTPAARSVRHRPTIPRRPRRGWSCRRTRDRGASTAASRERAEGPPAGHGMPSGRRSCRADRHTRSGRTLVLLQQPHRLLRRDRQVPCRPAHLGEVVEGAVRSPRSRRDAFALPHPDCGGLATQHNSL